MNETHCPCSGLAGIKVMLSIGEFVNGMMELTQHKAVN